MTNTGIEIHVALSTGQRTIGKLLTALHLQKLGNAMANLNEAVISVDGVERVEPLYEAHRIDVAPGTHHVEMWMRGKAPGPEGMQKAMWSKALDVEVSEGKVTRLLYTPHDGFGAKLELML